MCWCMCEINFHSIVEMEMTKTNFGEHLHGRQSVDIQKVAVQWALSDRDFRIALYHGTQLHSHWITASLPGFGTFLLTCIHLYVGTAGEAFGEKSWEYPKSWCWAAAAAAAAAAALSAAA